MLTGKQKRHLRRLAQKINPVMQIGKNALTDNFYQTFLDALDAHELIKVSVLPNCFVDKETLVEELCKETNCQWVQTIGNQLIFYKPTTKDNVEKIELPA